MKKSLPSSILITEAVLCLALVAISTRTAGHFSGVMAFPYEQIGQGLRALSLSGTVGNLAAIGLYLLICMLPCMLLFLKRKQKFHLEDSLIPVLCLLLFYVLYSMINPGEIALAGGFAEALPIAKAVLGGSVYAILIGYGVLRVLRLFYNSELEQMQRYLFSLLFLLNILFVAEIFLVGVGDAVSSLKAMYVQNTARTGQFGINAFFIFLGFLANSLPYAVNILIVFSAISLLRSFAADRYSEETITCGKRLSKLCGVALFVLVMSNVLFTLLQLLFGSVLFHLNIHIQIPLFSILFILVCLLVAKLMAENKLLKEENDSII